MVNLSLTKADLIIFPVSILPIVLLFLFLRLNDLNPNTVLVLVVAFAPVTLCFLFFKFTSIGKKIDNQYLGKNKK